MNRVPEELRLKLHGMALDAAYFGCGTEIRFNLEDEEVKVLLKRMPGKGIVGGYGIAEVYYGSFQGSWQDSPRIIGNDAVEIVVKKPENIELLSKLTREYRLPYDPELVRILLPYEWGNCLIDIKGKCSPPRQGQTPERKCLSYGSSITHGGTAIRPSGSYAMRIARNLGVDLINLGFAGSAQMEGEMADYIAERQDWDFATLEMGVNVIEMWSTEQFAEKVDYFVSRIAEANSDKWIFCIDLFSQTMDFERNPKIREYREVVKRKVESVKLPKLVYICGRDLLTSVSELTADVLHPSEDGMEEIARNLTDIMEKHMK